MCGWFLFLHKKGRNFMLAQAQQSYGKVVQVRFFQELSPLRAMQSGRLSRITFYNYRALGT
jgi:hypothetical protein